MKEEIAAEGIDPALVAFNRKSRERSAETQALINNDALMPIALKIFGEQNLRLLVARPDDRLGVLRSQNSLQSIVLSLKPLADDLIATKQKSAKMVRAQEKRAKAERIRLGDSQLSLRKHIRQLALQREYQALSPLDLWPHFVYLFRTLEPDAKVCDEGCNSKDWSIKFEYDPKKFGSVETALPTIRTLGFPRFRTILREVRKEADSPAIE